MISAIMKVIKKTVAWVLQRPLKEISSRDYDRRGGREFKK
jgi:hypothetical protein